MLKEKSMVREFSFLCLLLVSVIVHNACFSQAPKAAEYAIDELLVKFKPNVSRSEAVSVHRRLNSKIMKHFAELNIDLVKFKEGWTLRKAIEVYQADPRVEYAEPNYTRRIQRSR